MEHIKVMSSDPEVLDFEQVDNLFKKRRRRRKAKRKAKKAGKKLGLRGKALRRHARAARQAVRATQLERKGKTRKAARVRSRKGQTAVGRGIRAAAFAPLAPFKKPMIKALRRKGVKNIPRKMRDLAPLFFREIIRKDSYQPSDNVEPISITAIIQAIINFFKKKKKDKEQGRDLAPIDDIIATGAQQVIGKLKGERRQREGKQGFLRRRRKGDRSLKAQELLIEPLRPMMASALRNVGAPAPTDIKDLTITFYNRIMKKDANTYMGIDSVDDDKGDSVLFQTIVPAVIGFLGALKNKKAQGQKMTKLEEIIVEKTEKVEGDLKSKVRDEGERRVGKFVLSPLVLGIIAVVVVGIIILVAKR